MVLEEVHDRPADTLVWTDADLEQLVDIDHAELADLDLADRTLADPVPPPQEPPLLPAGPVGLAVAELRRVDRAMARALRAISGAGPTDGWPAERLIALEAQATGWDVAFLHRCVQILGAMPALWLAFDRGQVSWSQLRGVVTAAKSLSVVDRTRLDAQLQAAVAQNGSAEPERLVETAADLAGLLDDARMRDRERPQERGSYLHVQARLFGGVDIVGYVDDLAGAVIADAVHAAADAPVEDDPDLGRDADGRPVPGAWGPPTARAAQLADGLERICAAYVAGASPGASTTTTVVVDITDLVDISDIPDPDIHDITNATTPREPAGANRRPTAPPDLDRCTGVPRATARLLWRLASGRLPLSRARIHALTCDSAYVPVLTDGDIPLAIGDAHDPIPTPVRRAVRTRDQGCRFPGCRAPAVATDLHHILPRLQGGPTVAHNLVCLCRRHHTLIGQPGWALTLHDDGRLVVQRGRYRHTSRPRLRPPGPEQPVSS